MRRKYEMKSHKENEIKYIHVVPKDGLRSFYSQTIKILCRIERFLKEEII